MNHQDIADRLDALRREESAAYKIEKARIEKERESLRELCGGIGHIFARPEPKGPGWFFLFGTVDCVVCKTWKTIPDRDAAMQQGAAALRNP